MVDPGDLVNRPEDPFVRNRTVAGGPRRDVVTLAGLLGDSDRAGCRRLYLTTQLDYFVEFRTDDRSPSTTLPRAMFPSRAWTPPGSP